MFIKYLFDWALRDGDKILLEIGYVPYYGSKESLPDHLYYIDVNDLEFKPME